MSEIIIKIYKQITSLVILVFVVFAIFSLPIQKVQAATVVTGDAGAILATSASLVGFLFLNSSETYTEAFYYGKSGVSIGNCNNTSNFSKGTLVTLDTITGGSVGYEKVVTGLTFNTTYYFWAVAIDSSNKTVCGSQKSFITYAPDISNVNASNITANTAILNGTVNAMGTGTYQVSFVWYKTGSGANSNVVGNVSGSTAQTFTLNLTGLSPGSTYNFYVDAYNLETRKIYSSALQTFTTPAGSLPPSFNISCSNNCASVVVKGSATFPNSISIFNTGPVAFDWSATDDQSWISLSPTSGTVPLNGAGSIAANIDTSSMLVGSYIGNVTVTPLSPPGGAPKTIQIYFTLGDPLIITKSVWKIFKSSDLVNVVQSFTFFNKSDYTASGLATDDYVVQLQIDNSAEQNTTSNKDFKVVAGAAPTVSSAMLGPPPDSCIDSTAVTVAWTYSGSSSQSAYQIKLTKTGNFNNPDFDSGKVISGSSSYIASGLDFNTTYQAQVTVWNSSDVASTPVSTNSWKTPKHAYPSVDFSWLPSNPAVNQLIQFTDQTQLFDIGGIGQRAWNWLFKAPAVSPNSTQQNPTYTYNSSGSYSVKLTVTDKDSYSCSLTKLLNIDRPIPIWEEVSPK